MGLDYHYDNSPRDIQKEVLIRQLRLAVPLGKPLTIHTREADEDILPILKEHVPKDHKIHIHCFTDTPELAKSLLDHFPNLYIGITGVITYTSNLNTSQVIRDMITSSPKTGPHDQPSPLRILLETDAPYMAPGTLKPEFLGLQPGQRIPFSHSAMIPWTAQFVADVVNSVIPEDGPKWSVTDVLRVGQENASKMYSI
ncbi:hypothetical protein FRC02_000049 [Tulasnella sp. 418]|nr:hypothetical protein FRC02_000049 [Tulasnella sp. 418]